MATAQLVDEAHGKELISHGGAVVYLDYLSNLARTMEAQSYLEIGTFSGASLAAIGCSAIAIDPHFSLSTEVVGKKRLCLLFQMASDDFFESYDPAGLLRRRIDLAFLDGMHLYEYLLRDLINTERYCHYQSVIALHDCLPPTFEMTSRQCRGATLNARYINYWTGDVWKLIPILEKYRPDIALTYVDCPPTGLVLLSRLDPASTVLAANYDSIVDEFREGPGDCGRLRSLLKRLAISPSVHPCVATGGWSEPERPEANGNSRDPGRSR